MVWGWSTWKDAVDPAQVVGGWATFVAALIAFAALLAAAIQVRLAQKISRESGALQAYREYLRLCFDHPDFSSFNMFRAKHPDSERFLGTNVLDEQSERYQWFLSILLNTVEEIVLNVSSKNEWRTALVTQLSYHGGALEVIWPALKGHYDQRLNNLVADGIAKAAAS